MEIPGVNWPLLFPVALSSLLTISCVLILRPLAIRVNLVDLPGGRKQHQGHVPLIGGIAMFFGFIFTVITLPDSLHVYRSLFAAGGLLIFIGILDDFHELTARIRLLAQIIAALMVTVGGNNQLVDLGHLVSEHAVTLHYLAIPVTVFGIVSVINAVNMLDGLDGLAGTLGLIECLLLALLAAHAGRLVDCKLLLIFSGALLGFLSFNFRFKQDKPAQIFMGDAGSTLIGLMVAWFTISLSQGPAPAASPVTMLWVMSVPLIDFAAIFIQRIARRTSPFQAGRDHIHHWLQHQGFSIAQTVLLICGLALGLGVIGIAGYYHHVVDVVSFSLFTGLFLLYLGWGLKARPVSD